MQNRILCAMVGAALLAGCAASPAHHHFTLSERQEAPLQQGVTPRIVITQTTLLDLIDQPQLVIRRSDNRVSIDEARRWAGPLRRDIPRLRSWAPSPWMNT